MLIRLLISDTHDDVIKWKHFPLYWPIVRGIHRSRGALMFSLIYAWTDSWANNGEPGDLRRYRAHYGVIVMRLHCSSVNVDGPSTKLGNAFVELNKCSDPPDRNYYTTTCYTFSCNELTHRSEINIIKCSSDERNPITLSEIILQWLSLYPYVICLHSTPICKITLKVLNSSGILILWCFYL